MQGFFARSMSILFVFVSWPSPLPDHGSLPIAAAQGTNFDTILRRAYIDGIRAPDFVESKIAPPVVELGDDLADRLHSHLNRGNEHSRHSTVIRLSRCFAEVVQRALLLQCEISSAREEYTFSWFGCGEAFDEAMMESTHGAGDAVLITVFPGLVVSRNGSMRAVCRARVKLTHREAA